ncbi:MAG TPA: hypothetical protein VNW95_09465 [Mucilaginibacter sp.]|jgi:hypothetical protein|nr:hypothetical protein [Mucilaginibacter sp.]
MPIELINNDEHKHILEKIDQLPFGDEHAGIYRASLEELFLKFNIQLKEIFDTIKAYREVADLITKRQPLVNKKKYIRVRLRNGNKKNT